jgi:hypothetical protein
VVGGGLAHLSYRSGSNDVRSLESRSFDDAGDADWVPDDLWVVSVHNSETIQYVIRSYAVCASATTIALG